MTLTYQYPVVYFYGDDEEDSEIIQKEGRIEPLKTDKEPYEAIVSAEGYFANRIWYLTGSFAQTGNGIIEATWRNTLCFTPCSVC